MPIVAIGGLPILTNASASHVLPVCINNEDWNARCDCKVDRLKNGAALRLCNNRQNLSTGEGAMRNREIDPHDVKGGRANSRQAGRQAGSTHTTAEGSVQPVARCCTYCPHSHEQLRWSHRLRLGQGWSRSVAASPAEDAWPGNPIQLLTPHRCSAKQRLLPSLLQNPSSKGGSCHKYRRPTHLLLCRGC